MNTQAELAMLHRDVEELRAANAHQSAEIEKLKDLDTKRMRAAVVALGGVAISLALYIWNILVER